AEDPAARPDAALTFVVDVSGSMAEPGRLDLVVESLHTLVDQLRPTDSVGLVTFSDTAKVIRPMTSVADRAGLHDAIGKLRTEGSTNLEAGLTTGFQVARQGAARRRHEPGRAALRRPGQQRRHQRRVA